MRYLVSKIRRKEESIKEVEKKITRHEKNGK